MIDQNKLKTRLVESLEKEDKISEKEQYLKEQHLDEFVSLSGVFRAAAAIKKFSNNEKEWGRISKEITKLEKETNDVFKRVFELLSNESDKSKKHPQHDRAKKRVEELCSEIVDVFDSIDNMTD